MTVTKDDIQNLHIKVDANKLEMHQAMNDSVAKPLNELTIEIRELIVDNRHQAEANIRISKDIEKLKTLTSGQEILISKLELNQSGILWVMTKCGVPLIIAALSANGIVGLLKYLNGQ